MITLKAYAPGVPYWSSGVTHYRPSSKQKEFYELFKKRFFKGEYIDLEGNTNYAYVFLFELLKDLSKHKQFSKTEKHVEILGQCCPAITRFASNELVRQVEKIGDERSIRRFEKNDRPMIFKSWGLGSRYKSALKLSAVHVNFLDRIDRTNNYFTDIDYCGREVIKLYVKTIDALKKVYDRKKTTIEDEFDFVADLVVRKVFRYKEKDGSFKDRLSESKEQLYYIVFEYCENVVRDAYNYSDLYIDYYSSTPIVRKELNNRIVVYVTEIHAKLAAEVAPLDEAVEIRLYTHSSSRWVRTSDKIIAGFNGDATAFVNKIDRLAMLNKHNPAVEEIYLKASKFITEHDRHAALSFYVQYIHSGLRLRKFEKKPLTRKAQQVLFTSNSQVKAFDVIIKDLTKSKNLPKALDAVSSFYGPRRSEIKLSKAAIAKVRKKHSGTVELLSEYLRDEDDMVKDEPPKAKRSAASPRQPKSTAGVTLSTNDSKFSALQREFLALFQKKELTLSPKEVDTFAKSKKVFKNQLIDSINDICYETLDDVLIEEDAGKYSIHPDYFQRIAAL